jgi:hypothetical protein
MLPKPVLKAFLQQVMLLIMSIAKQLRLLEPVVWQRLMQRSFWINKLSLSLQTTWMFTLYFKDLNAENKVIYSYQFQRLKTVLHVHEKLPMNK